MKIVLTIAAVIIAYVIYELIKAPIMEDEEDEDNKDRGRHQ